MFNILIVEDNMIQSHMLANHVSENLGDVRVYSMVTTGKEAINIIENELVDIILLDLGLPDFSGIEILNYICEKHICKYYQSVIIFTGELDLMSKVINNENVFDYISKTSEPNAIIRSLENLLQYKGKQKSLDLIKEQINIELQKLQYNFSYAGTKYLAECIYEVFCFDEKFIFNLKKQVYPIVAENITNL